MRNRTRHSRRPVKGAEYVRRRSGTARTLAPAEVAEMRRHVQQLVTRGAPKPIPFFGEWTKF